MQRITCDCCLQLLSITLVAKLPGMHFSITIAIKPMVDAGSGPLPSKADIDAMFWQNEGHATWWRCRSGG